MNRHALHGKDGKLFYYSTLIDDFYNDICQGPDYEDKELQDIDLEADDEISKGEMESLEAGTLDGLEGQSEGQTSIQDDLEADEEISKGEMESLEART